MNIISFRGSSYRIFVSCRHEKKLYNFKYTYSSNFMNIYLHFCYLNLYIKFFITRAYSLKRQKKEENSIIFSDETNKDINDFIFGLFRVFIERASINF